MLEGIVAFSLPNGSLGSAASASSTRFAHAMAAAAAATTITERKRIARRRAGSTEAVCVAGLVSCLIWTVENGERTGTRPGGRIGIDVPVR